ncbi:MAG: hypothetical protein HZC22_04495 [Rhodocyclales bacterium]|nr:hypothetical protein [Rhodocyclales bacterium]
MRKSATNTPPLLELAERELDAIETVANAMESAEEAIDLQFGAGFAEKNPVLVAGYLQAAATTYLAGTLGERLRQARVGVRHG